MSTLSWKAPEYIHTDKTSDWYWIVGIIALSLGILSIILNDAIFGILIVVAAIVLTMYAARKPEIVTFELRENGIQLGYPSGPLLYPYAHLQSFWVETRDAYPRIIFKSEKRLSPYISILLGGTDPEQVRAFLAPHLTETEHSEPLLAKLLIYLGF